MRDIRGVPNTRSPLTLRTRVVRIGAALAWTVSVGTAPCLARDDVQSWNTVELSKRLGPHWEVFFLPELRIRDDAGELFYHEYRQGVRYKPSKHWQVGLNYLFVRNESSGKPLEEHTGELDLTPKTTLGPLEVSLRGRLALRTIQGSAGEQEWQFRVMPKMAYPTQFAGHTLIPYVADDLFYDYTRDAWNQNRVFLGLAVPMGKARGAETTVEVYD
ncbi:MAG: DUF2490 domain-containing protein, partial [Candidatus Omnitrophica bacterium]|nr:DUF2490 domain-containing protein [Candidatus Omnitrophota bacterium]